MFTNLAKLPILNLKKIFPVFLQLLSRCMNRWTELIGASFNLLLRTRQKQEMNFVQETEL